MPYVVRDQGGNIIAVSERQDARFVEQVGVEDAELMSFVARLESDQASIGKTDLDFVRVLEDLVDLLISKGVILFTELPPSAQDKISRRQRMRSELGDQLNLIEDD